MTVPAQVKELVERFDRNLADYKQGNKIVADQHRLPPIEHMLIDKIGNYSGDRHFRFKRRVGF